MATLESDIDKQVLSILSDETDQRLLSLSAGLTITSCLLIHPSPRKLIKTIVSQRYSEDLLLLSAVIGSSAQIIRQQNSEISEKLLEEKADLILNKLFVEESQEYKDFRNSMPTISKNQSQIATQVNKFLDISKKKNNLDELKSFVLTHRSVLSLASDFYLLTLVITTETNIKDEYENFVKYIWAGRTMLTLFRDALK